MFRPVPNLGDYGLANDNKPLTVSQLLAAQSVRQTSHPDIGQRLIRE